MKDPLQNFDWSSVYGAYDDRCYGFNKKSPHLDVFRPKPPELDRYLYYRLVQEFSKEPKKFGNRASGLYRALLYWKLYSQPTCDLTIAASLAQPKESLLELLNNTSEHRG
jgi:hypothetical protein